MVALTRAMVDAGDRLTWTGAPIVDKHSVGGRPANRTTPIAIAPSDNRGTNSDPKFGAIMPKATISTLAANPITV